tara:strand:- start:11 stop:247 length:237 start_codon:yes stop_codon:yes gene_type:complete
MKQFKKTPITKERLLSIGFECFSCGFQYYLNTYDYIQFYDASKQIYYWSNTELIIIDREFKTMEDIKQLITGLTGKRL